MREYRQKVKRLAKERTGEPFFNGSEDHATIIIENMFRIASSEVCILTAHLAPRVYCREGVIEWARIFLADDDQHKLRVIAREGDLALLESNPLYDAIKFAPNFELRALSDDFHDQLKPSFMLADDDCYRFEPDKTKCEAVAAFGSLHAQSLREPFDQLWKTAKQVNLDNLTAMDRELPLTV